MNATVAVSAGAAALQFILDLIEDLRIDDCFVGVVLQGEYFAPPLGADNMSLAMPRVTPVPPKSGSAASAGGNSSGLSRRWKACPTR